MKKWTDLIHEYGIEGARSAWEDACCSLIRIQRQGERVELVDGAAGDGGIDILVGEMGHPLDVYQCKFFPDGINDAQKEQIRRSYRRAKENPNYELKDWYLCLPKAMSLGEIAWFDHWRAQHARPEHEITNVPPDTLMILAYQQNMIGALFNDDKRKTLDVILVTVNEILSMTKQQASSSCSNADIERASGNILCLLAMKVHSVMPHRMDLLEEHYKRVATEKDANAAANFLSSALFTPHEDIESTQRDIFAMSQGSTASLAYDFVQLYESHIQLMKANNNDRLLIGQPLNILYNSLLDPSLRDVRRKYYWPR